MYPFNIYKPIKKFLRKFLISIFFIKLIKWYIICRLLGILRLIILILYGLKIKVEISPSLVYLVSNINKSKRLILILVKSMELDK